MRQLRLSDNRMILRICGKDLAGPGAGGGSSGTAAKGAFSQFKRKTSSHMIHGFCHLVKRNYLGMLDEPPGDTVMLYEVAGNEECPVCRSNLPPFSYCPSCGMPWSDSGKSVETLLSSMRQEAARNIRDPKASGASRLAWYWSHIGAIDLARQMGVITEDRRQALYEEMQPLKPTDTDGTMNGGVV